MTATFVLVMTLIRYDSAVTFEVRDIKSQSECISLGRAWVAQARARSDTDVSTFRCDVQQPK